ncbi:DUF1569 domain-containing protein [Aquimarina litoralis]|uniref:DUF1569 domain-containing protein n=1 Tax=Aquimarina litoralis TaxID=584605 RepID=UPI001C55D055|nr:DUF1569 domain-containing protein [Aquimarina litoralis]MBW1294745.1 DUF1569 domain-containing protein [Aquimarina litoralis]
MENQLQDIAYLIQFRDHFNSSVSKAPIAWHLDHMLKVINKINTILGNSDPTVYENRFNFWRTISFTFRYIPRGKGKSPASVLPPNEIKTESILSQLEEARTNLSNFESLDQNANFMHPVFGQLNKSQSKCFLKIHTKHHLKIIRDILGKE